MYIFGASFSLINRWDLNRYILLKNMPINVLSQELCEVDTVIILIWKLRNEA